MNINMKCLLAAAGLSELFSGFSASCMRAEASELGRYVEEKTNPVEKAILQLVNEAENGTRNIDEIQKDIEKQLDLWVKFLPVYDHLRNDKWAISNDFMMIIGKYFENNKDYINVMKTNSKYQQLVLMYKFNPISDTSLFENIQTQHFYKEEDVNNKKEGMYQYVYWPCYDYNEIKDSKKDNEIFKNIELKSKEINREREIYPLEIKDGNCVVPEGVTKIGSYCFSQCSTLTNITLPSTLKEIGDSAFSETKITSVIMSEGVTKIEDKCFYRCYHLTNIILPSTLREIGNNAFYSSNITSITIPEGVVKIEDQCFDRCYHLTNITLPSTLKEIGNYAFYGSNINSITIPEGVTKIGNYCFCCEFVESCLKGIPLLPSTLKEIGPTAFAYTDITSITIPEGIIKIEDQCFCHCYHLTNIILPSTLKEIGFGAFAYTGITSITIPEGVIKIGNWCFQYCSFLNIKLPSTLEEIGNTSFKASNIASITIPKSVIYIGKDCFTICRNLTSIKMPKTVLDKIKSNHNLNSVTEVAKHLGVSEEIIKTLQDDTGSVTNLQHDIQGTTSFSDSTLPGGLEPLRKGEVNE